MKLILTRRRYRSQQDGDALDAYMLQTAATNNRWDNCMSRMNELDRSMRAESAAWAKMQAAADADQQTMKEREEEDRLSQQRYAVERLLLDVEQAELVAEVHDLRLYLRANLGTWR